MLKNNPPDVVYGAFSQAFFEGAIKLFQRDKQLQNVVMTDAVAREQAIKHFFSRALREAREDRWRYQNLRLRILEMWSPPNFCFQTM